MPRVKAHTNTPRLTKNTVAATAIPTCTVNRQLSSCFVVSTLRADDSSDMSPVCDVSPDNVVSSAMTASIPVEEERNKGFIIGGSSLIWVFHGLQDRRLACMSILKSWPVFSLVAIEGSLLFIALQDRYQAIRTFRFGGVHEY